MPICGRRYVLNSHCSGARQTGVSMMNKASTFPLSMSFLNWNAVAASRAARSACVCGTELGWLMAIKLVY
jgi:hypothetical protein